MNEKVRSYTWLLDNKLDTRIGNELKLKFIFLMICVLCRGHDLDKIQVYDIRF